MAQFLHTRSLFQKYLHAADYLSSSLLQHIAKKHIPSFDTLKFWLVAELIEYLLKKKNTFPFWKFFHTNGRIFRNAIALKIFIIEGIKYLYY